MTMREYDVLWTPSQFHRRYPRGGGELPPFFSKRINTVFIMLKDERNMKKHIKNNPKEFGAQLQKAVPSGMLQQFGGVGGMMDMLGKMGDLSGLLGGMGGGGGGGGARKKVRWDPAPPCPKSSWRL